jgi:hypothetical protein
MAAPFLIALAACAADPPVPPLTAEESAAVTKAVEDTVETLSLVNTTNLAVTALTFRLIPCATVETDRSTFVTVTYACTTPFKIEGTVHFEKSTPEQLISITDLMINNVSVDSATTLVIPTDPTQPRTFDGALVVVGPTRELDSVVSASWVMSGRCFILDAAGFVSVNSVDHSWTITGKRICRRF